MIETAESRNSFCSSRVCGVVEEEEEAKRNIAHTYRIFFPVSFFLSSKKKVQMLTFLAFTSTCALWTISRSRKKKREKFGMVFDLDGVIYRSGPSGKKPVGD